MARRWIAYPEGEGRTSSFERTGAYRRRTVHAREARYFVFTERGVCERFQTGAYGDVRTVEFDHPLYIMFSSGTTGIPKCIVHGHGGTLLQHVKEHRLQTNINNGDRIFYFTTCLGG